MSIEQSLDTQTNEPERIGGGFLFHHARPLFTCTYGVVEQVIPLDEDVLFRRAYYQLRRMIGHTPIFMAVGSTEQDVRMTQYQYQSDDPSEDEPGTVTKPRVLFSFQSVPEGKFMDYFDWFDYFVLQVITPIRRSTKESRVFKPYYSKEDWLRKARLEPHTVQYVVPSLDLRSASLVTAPDEATKKQLEAMGFKNVVVGKLENYKYTDDDQDNESE